MARIDPITPGIDLAGVVVESSSPRISPGASVIAHGYELGVSRHGGFAELADVPAEWLVTTPPSLSHHDAMVIGTAGFTAALSVEAVIAAGITPDAGPVLVTGATGGVGSVAIALLGQQGYEVVASTGRTGRTDWLTALGATAVIDRLPNDAKALGRETYAAVVDSVGGTTLHAALASLKYGGIAAASGNTGGFKLETTVFPFILRGVHLVGIDSVAVPIERRQGVWDRVAEVLEPRHYELLAGETVDLDGLPSALDVMAAGATEGRTLVRPTPTAPTSETLT